MTEKLKVASAAFTDQGLVRENNEDTVLLKEIPAGILCVVADGMGGHAGGEFASQLACATVERLSEAARHLDGEEIPALLIRMVREADRAICETARSDPRLYGMGTTLTLSLVGEGDLYFAHVGDSRLYLLRDEALRQLTEDHTEVQWLVQAGHLTTEEARHSPHRHRLSQAVGTGMELAVCSGTERLRAGDRLLLCSDGLCEMVDDERLASILTRAATPRAAGARLVEAANRGGGRDNISTIVLFVEREGADG